VTVAVLGIDPGLDGALALYGPTGLLRLEDIPTLEVGTKRQVDHYALARLVDDMAGDVAEVWLEKVGTRPGEGAVGAFSFGRGYGVLLGVCAANFLSIVDVTPAAWKAALKVRGEKDESRLRASALMPRHAGLWPLKKHHGRAEAALIAWHGFHQSERLKGVR
jgi:crossover junction endodeoxyribonuclease RuvC